MIVPRLADYIVTQTHTPLSVDARHAAKRCLVDWMAAAIAGHRSELSERLQHAMRDELDRGGARLVASGRQALPGVAALINGASAHVMEFDDIYRDALYHPGAPVIAAALAVAQTAGLDGARLLNAVVCGYEISNRIGVAVNPQHYRYWHTTATVGAFGAAAAAASAMNLNREACGHALANAASFAAGLQQAFRSDAMTKPLHVGRAAQNGVFAALTAQQGITGAAGMLDGDIGFTKAMGSGGDLTEVMADLGERYTIRQTTQKNHGCCGHIFASIDAVLAITANHTIDIDTVRAINIGTYQAALDITGRADPATPMEARFSTPWCVAAALVQGSVRLRAFTSDALADATLRSLADKVTLRLDDEINSKFPYQRQSRVELYLQDDTRLTHFAETRKGDPEDPLSDDELNDKFTELAGPHMPKDVVDRLRETLWRIDETVDLQLFA